MGRPSHARQNLIDTAYALVWERSYGAVTIDQICEAAGVKKGSFYYFFDSKPDLMLAAINAKWEERSHLLHHLFRTEVPGLVRINSYFEEMAKRQISAHKTVGRVLGCPYYSLASEVCSREEKIRERILELYALFEAYFVKAIQDALAADEILPCDPVVKARILLSLWQGVMTRARIENNIEPILSFPKTAREFLGVRSETVLVD